MAGVLPGIMLAGLFMAYIFVHALLRPEGLPPRGEAMGFLRKLRESLALLPVVLLILAVLGSIYAGLAPAPDAAAPGVAANGRAAGGGRGGQVGEIRVVD